MLRLVVTFICLGVFVANGFAIRPENVEIIAAGLDPVPLVNLALPPIAHRSKAEAKISEFNSNLENDASLSNPFPRQPNIMKLLKKVSYICKAHCN